MDFSKLPPWLIAIALGVIAIAFVYVALAKPPAFRFAGLEFGKAAPEATTPGAFPAGAVVAFDGGRYETKSQADPAHNGCPVGWIRYLQAEGRFILGARPPFDGGPGGYELRDSGGSATHTLTVEEMPDHHHGSGSLTTNLQKNIGTGFVHMTDTGVDLKPDHNGKGSLWGSHPTQPRDPNYGDHEHDISGQTDKSGLKKPHNNMPPYIALYFCKKEG